jgi:hypothetical protein
MRARMHSRLGRREDFIPYETLVEALLKRREAVHRSLEFA